MINPLMLLKGLGLGAGMMYFFDPISGNRRRALVRDQINHACALGSRQAGVVYRDASNRLQGVKSEMGHLIEDSDQPIMERFQEGAMNMGRTLGMQGKTWSPTAKAAAIVGGVGLAAALMKKRDLLALAFGAAALAMMSKESCSQSRSWSQGRYADDLEEDSNLEASVPTEHAVVHNL
jgi:hypothetical protein